jgi:glycosyltransferase involved in cell wall biosynthesis
MLERLSGFAHERFPLSSGRDPKSALSSIPVRLPQLAARARHADVIHCHGDVASTIALPLLWLRPSVVTCQGLHMIRRLDGARRRAMGGALAAVAAACHTVICSSAEEVAELEPAVRARDRTKLRVIYNGIDPPSAQSEATRASARAELGLSPDMVAGVFVGQLEHRKQPLLAAQAAIRVHAEAPFVLLVAGDGELAPQIRALDGPAVRALGYRTDMDRLLAASDVYVHPSEREGMSFALLEAMSHGLTVVAADSSSNPEAIGEAGLLFAPGDESDLTRALIRVGREPELRAALGAAAAARARDTFSPSAFLAASSDVYREALGGPTAPVRSAAGQIA